MAKHREWLKSLSDKQLDEEIYYGRKLATMSRHREFYKRQHQEALEERRSRKEGKQHHD